MLGFKREQKTVLMCRGTEAENIVTEFAKADCAGITGEISWGLHIREFIEEQVYIIHWRGQMKRYDRFKFRV